MSSTNEKAPIANLPPEISELITGPKIEKKLSEAEQLFLSAQSLLSERKGVRKTELNGVPTVVTRCAHATRLSEDSPTVYYVRLARNDTGDEALPFLVFDKSSTASKIDAEGPSPILFEKTIDGDIAVFYNKGVQPEYDDPQVKSFVSDVILDIHEQQDASVKDRLKRRLGVSATRLTGDLGKKISAFYGDSTGIYKRADRYSKPELVDTKGNRRKKVTKWTAGILAASYVYMPFSGFQADATIEGIPMPAPLEWLVDWNNHVDHTAQGFDRPEGAQPVSIGQPIESIPMLDEYNTSDVPSTSYKSPNKGNTEDFSDESKPGLYESTFDFAMIGAETGHVKTQTEFNHNGCYTIQGEFTRDKTEVFTQTPGINDKIELSVANVHELQVCKKDKDDKDFRGSLFIYQNED